MQEEYDRAFDTLVERLRSRDWFAQGEWETRREDPPAAYLHLSRPTWNDAAMSGIHLETYVQERERRAGCAPVCLHCEGGFPEQARFMRLFTERAADTIRSWEGYEIQGPQGTSVCEIKVSLRVAPAETCEALLIELERLKTLSPIIDQCVSDCQSAARADASDGSRDHGEAV